MKEHKKERTSERRKEYTRCVPYKLRGRRSTLIPHSLWWNLLFWVLFRKFKPAPYPTHSVWACPPRTRCKERKFSLTGRISIHQEISCGKERNFLTQITPATGISRRGKIIQIGREKNRIIMYELLPPVITTKWPSYLRPHFLCKPGNQNGVHASV